MNFIAPKENRSKIITEDQTGYVNGWLMPIWNVNEDESRPEQVYVTAVAPYCSKGPHLHKNRIGRFTLVTGRVEVRIRTAGGEYHDIRMFRGGQLLISAGLPCAIYNTGDTEALLINMPSPAWSKEDPDEWPVENWEHLR